MFHLRNIIIYTSILCNAKMFFLTNMNLIQDTS